MEGEDQSVTTRLCLRLDKSLPLPRKGITLTTEVLRGILGLEDLRTDHVASAVTLKRMGKGVSDAYGGELEERRAYR